MTEKLLARLKNAYTITALTGAGISAESGVPTFRGEDGLWKNHKVEELATPEALNNDSETFWQFYNWRRELIAKVKPNLGHYALVDFERLFEEFTLITQNVDNLHHTAGNKRLIELHGNITRSRCLECGADKEEDFYVPTDGVPKCKKCGGLVRPDVVLFNENLNEKVLRKAQQASAECEVFFSIGTSSIVEPAAALPYLAKANGSYLVEINPEETPLSSHCDECLRGAAVKVLPRLVMIIEKLLSK